MFFGRRNETTVHPLSRSMATTITKRKEARAPSPPGHDGNATTIEARLLLRGVPYPKNLGRRNYFLLARIIPREAVVSNGWAPIRGVLLTVGERCPSLVIAVAETGRLFRFCLRFLPPDTLETCSNWRIRSWLPKRKGLGKRPRTSGRARPVRRWIPTNGCVGG